MQQNLREEGQHTTGIIIFMLVCVLWLRLLLSVSATVGTK